MLNLFVGGRASELDEGLGYCINVCGQHNGLNDIFWRFSEVLEVEEYSQILFVFTFVRHDLLVG